MKLTASPFDPHTGDLLPVYRDAYLRGDLSKASAQAVEAYLHRDAGQTHETLARWQHLRAADDAAAAPSWVHRQLAHIRAEPVRFRRRAGSLVASAVLVGTMVFAGTHLPSEHTPFTDNLPTEEAAGLLGPASGAEASVADASLARRMVTVRGRILNVQGAPLVGATVLQPGTSRGVSTNAQGEYALVVPAGTVLRYGYGGYQDADLHAQADGAAADVTLRPRAAAKRHWWSF
ncbi:carboxypeptidase-like regulatory domain-containing protein [Hymenobacter actinosclerus]|uniref:Carboxypeptidase regulatory-like domain n=1 Tax=Hymenobacter actinosclerus TaxID=82805 RepID=A0A1I0IB70_9BACT|nr:carboxypeptidase-like regulatory domain-containing protein [Hymenobacter actinosclerus]SET93101.1 Carboxypeptidase regulatory-like domain [Hymenobacter actinosclerus]